MVKRKRPGYRRAVEWIALNDEPVMDELEMVSDQVCVVLVAELYGFEPIKVAIDILEIRDKIDS